MQQAMPGVSFVLSGHVFDYSLKAGVPELLIDLETVFYPVQNNGITASLFYGLCGTGYEMLRYALPDKTISVL